MTTGERVKRLEREVRWTRVLGALAVLALACVVLVGAGQLTRLEPALVDGAEPEIEVVIRPSVREFVSEAQVAQLRRRLHQRVSAEDCKRTLIVIGVSSIGEPGFHAEAVLPELRGGTYAVRRTIQFFTESWSSAFPKPPGAEPVSFHTRDSLSVRRVFKIKGKTARVYVGDALSYRDVLQVLKAVGRGAFTFVRESDKDGNIKPSLPGIRSIERTKDGALLVLPPWRPGYSFTCTLHDGSLRILEVGYLVP